METDNQAKAQTDPEEGIIKKDIESQTNPVQLESIGVNTDEKEIGIYLPQEGGTVWVYSPRGLSRGPLRNGAKQSGAGLRDIPRGE